MTSEQSVVSSAVKILRSRRNPLPTQVEGVDPLVLLVQVIGFWAFAAVWFAVAFVGDEPIHVTPIQVNEETSKNYDKLGNYG